MKYLPCRESFRSDEELIEWAADGVVQNMGCPDGITAAERLAGMRFFVKALLQLYKIVPPSDSFLDELLTEMSEWHDAA